MDNFINLEKLKTEYRDFLLKRKDEKRLVYSMGQVELRTLKGPNIVDFKKVFGNYYQFCESLGFENKFLEESLPENIVLRKDVIITDTREQKPFKFIPTKIKKLEFGDYTADYKIFIERKSLSDLLGTFTSGYERFRREFIRAKDSGAYMIVLVTETLENFNRFNSLSPILSKLKITPAFVGHRIREFINEFDNCQFLFVNGKRAKDIAELILLGEFDFSSVDLQLLEDTLSL